MRDNKKMINNLNRIEGQIRGIKNMLEQERCCEDVLVQLSAVNSAIASIAKTLLFDHLGGCVVDGIKNGETETTIESLIRMLDGYLKLKNI